MKTIQKTYINDSKFNHYATIRFNLIDDMKSKMDVRFEYAGES